MLTPILLVRPNPHRARQRGAPPGWAEACLLRGAEAEVVEDAPDGEGVRHERDDAHALAAAGADERIHFVDLRDQPCPAGRTPLGRRVCHRQGPAGLGWLACAPDAIGVLTVEQRPVPSGIGDVVAHPRQPLERIQRFEVPTQERTR